MTERDKWIIVGVFIALAGILLIVIAVCVFCCLRRRRRRQQQQTIMVLQGQAGQKAAAEKRASDDAADAPVAADELPLPHQLSSASLSNRGRSNAGGGFAQWTITPNDNATVSASQVQVQTASTLRAEVDAARGLWPILLERNVPEGSTTGGGPAGSAQTEWT
jgi:hypothetical protein